MVLAINIIILFADDLPPDKTLNFLKTVEI